MSNFIFTNQFYNDEKGRTLPKARLYFYDNNTFNFTDVYSDPELTQVLDNPVTADGAGRFPQIFMDISNTYRVWLKDRNDVQVTPYIDDYSPSASSDLILNSKADTFADLRTIEPVFENQVITLIGHTITGVGGGMFRAVLDGSGLTDDNGVTAVTVGGAGWIRSNFNALSIQDFGCIDDGLDKTALIKSFLEFHYANKVFHSQPYFIAGTGADSGGVSATISNSMTISCEDGVEFYTDDLDNDLIRCTADQSITEAIEYFHWVGGKFNQSNQKNSTSIPFAAEYPPVNLGSSATTDGLSIRMLINSDSEAGCNLLTVSNISTYGGDHWESAGGDSGIFASGADMMLLTHNKCIGARDLGIYTSSSEVSNIGSSCVITQNEFINCFHGCAGKRLLNLLSISDNTANNCVRAFLSEQVSGFGVEKTTISNNITTACLVTVKIDQSHGATIENNWAYNSGATLEDGTSIITALDFNFIDLIDSNDAYVSNNRAIGALAAYNADSRGTAFEIDGTDNAMIISNVIDGWRNMGRETNSPTNTTFINNTPKNIVNISTIQGGGTGLREQRVQTDNTILNMTEQAFNSTDKDTPILYRRGQTNVGIYFSTNTVGLTGAGNKRIEINNNGVGFNGSTPISKPTISGVSGNAVLTSLLTKLHDYGLINNTTT